MNAEKLRVLMVMEQCNPEWSSVPLVGYNFYQAISKLADVTLVTHYRNKHVLSQVLPDKEVVYIQESAAIRRYYKLANTITNLGRMNWPLYHTLNYPIYAEFNRKVYRIFKDKIVNGDYDVVHALTPMLPRYPVKLVKACKNTPFLLGPVNGGVPFPPGFQKVARQEFSQLNFLRAIGRALIPGYVETYKKADKVLSGSTYTLDFLKKTFEIPDSHIDLFYENGILKDFLTSEIKIKSDSKINLLFVGRLVPYKGVDILTDAIDKLSVNIRERISLTVVGDGSEKQLLQEQVKALNLEREIEFTGWVKPQEILDYYRDADIFCFPSIREFGGAVVLEAMASGLPCIVVNNGGIAEYVTEQTGFRIDPISREYIVTQLAEKLELLIQDGVLRKQMATQAVERAKEFEWGHKAERIVDIYRQMIADKSQLKLSSEFVAN